MSNASIHHTNRFAASCFMLAIAFFVLACTASPLFLVAAFGLVAAGLGRSRHTQDYLFGAALSTLLLFAFGYQVGKDLARHEAHQTPTGAAAH